MEIRSFLAFELPKPVKETVTRISGEMRQTALEVRWVRPESIHLTIVFLGPISSDRIDPMAERLGPVCANTRPFTVFLKPMGCFPNNRSPRVIWLGLGGDLDAMSRFRDALQHALSSFGVKEEHRAFKPHLTLGRFKKPGESAPGLEHLMARYADLTSSPCTLNELVLFKSDLKPGGAVYTKIASFPLSL